MVSGMCEIPPLKLRRSHSPFLTLWATVLRRRLTIRALLLPLLRASSPHALFFFRTCHPNVFEMFPHPLRGSVFEWAGFRM